jgi:hypothetical protein
MSFDPKFYIDSEIRPAPKKFSKIWVTVAQLLFLAAAAGVTVFFALTVFS